MRLIYLAPLPWSSFAQRPHETVRCFHSSCNGKVLWVNPYPTRLPKLEDITTRPKKQGYSSTPIPDWLTVLTPRALPIEPLPLSTVVNGLLWKNIVRKIQIFSDSTTILGVGKPSLLALEMLSKRLARRSFYDAMDDFPLFYSGLSRLSMSKKETLVIKAADVVITSSSLLKKRFEKLEKDVCFIPNAFSLDKMPDLSEKSSNSKINARPVIGYVGTMAQWFDWQLVSDLAKSVPHAEFKLVGPIYAPAGIPLPNNVTVTGPVSHDDAIATMNSFDIGMIPFMLNGLTASVDPIKYYEYRALGIPVLSTPFGEMASRNEKDGVYHITKGFDLGKVFQSAIARGRDVEDALIFRSLHSWKHRFKNSGIFTAPFTSSPIP